eukprot:3219601-Rhodomonas_salina.2
MSVEPVRATLADWLTTCMSAVQTSLTVPMRAPLVTSSRALVAAMEECRQKAVVSEVHAVASHAVAPSRTALLDPCDPIPLPCKMTRTEPVLMRLASSVLLTTVTSDDRAPVRL